MIAVIIGVTLLTFLLMNFTPGDPAELITKSRYGIEHMTQADVQMIRVQEGLDAPLYVQYLKWLEHIVHGDLGCSLINKESVLSAILLRFPATFQLAVAGTLIALLIGIPIGVIAAIRQYSAIDNLITTGAMLGVSIPGFWLALLLIQFFSLYLGWLPVCGYGRIENLVMPALTLGIGVAAVMTRLTRSSMLEVLRCDYIRTARAKGLSEVFVIGKHALKNALIPVITVLGMQFGRALEGAVIIETIFALPGIGKLLIDSIYLRDFSMIHGIVLFIAVMFVLINLIVDISYTYLDPRIRYGSKA
jgi:peptide/nickel transport system permease protein